ncbi:hypothetical protein [Rhodococcus sp. W8901]|uniref:hypothetical protein n=1 Tax=Rhodococcus sp. W8901 TaxID=2742603 RepID=UPI0015833773|nr:hypothetical protein [Rhodococcus sp. W8901]QKT11581.1 hypothetical protein HUN07_13285 [Rhodococcus sp. W8901]
MNVSKVRARVIPTGALAAAISVIGGGIAFAQDGGSSGSDGSSRSLGSLGTGSLGSTDTGSLGSSGAQEGTPLTFDGWGTCPVEDPAVSTCATVVVRGGDMRIGGLKVPIPDGGLKIAGGVKYGTPDPDGNFEEIFVPQMGTSGVFSNPISIPGGALGIDTPLNLTQIAATVEPVGIPSVDVLDLKVSMPVRLKLENPLLGGSCYLGSESNPVILNLATTGNPPSRPIGGAYQGAVFPNVSHTDDTFAVPAASGCGPLGALNWAVNLRAGTPSVAGSNELATTSDVYTVPARRVRPPA